MSARSVSVAAGARTLLREIDLDVQDGEFVAIVGPNGVGKTTLLCALAGVRPCSAGSVRLDGAATRDFTAAQRARAIALLSGDAPEADGLLVREAVTIGRYAHRAWWDWRRSDEDAEAVDAALGRVRLRELADRSLGTLSSGERARVWLALALALDAKTLLLDEPTSHLDVRFAREVLDLLHAIARSGASVVVVLHDLNEAAAYADRVALLGEGRLLCYGPPRIALDPRALEQAYDMPFTSLEGPSGYRVLPTHVAPLPGHAPSF